MTLCLFNALLIASPGYAQKLKETKISIRFSGETLNECIKQIGKSTDIQFAFNPEELNIFNAASFKVRKTSVQEVLEQLLKNTNLSFVEVGTKVVIYNNTVSSTPINVLANAEIPAPIPISGTIVNEKGEPVSSVSINVKGTNRSAVSNENGLFTIEADENEILVFTSIAHGSREIAVGKNKTFKVELTTIVNALEDVVVIGYGTQKRKDITGSIASVKGEVLKNLPVRSVAEALQGRIAGVFVSGDNGAPGASPSIIIRGPVNIRGTGPLYVVDGIPFTDAGNSFNMQDVENISVMKDASAAAIYGAAAAGGVIIVTTKKGKAGKLLVSANATVGSRKALNLPRLLSKDEFITARIANGDDADAFFGPASGRAALPNTNWFNNLYNNSLEQNYTASIAGGNDKSTYYMSLGYNDQQGVRIDNFVKRYTIRINSDHKINSHLKVGQNFYLSSQNENPTNLPNQGAMSFRSSPIMKVLDPTNVSGGGWGRTPSYFQGGNDFAQEMVNYNRNNNYTANLAVYAELEIIKGLKIRQNLALKYSSDDFYYSNFRYDWGQSRRDFTRFGKGYGKGLDFLGNTTINYEKKIGKHDFAILAGYEALRSKGDNISGYADFSNANLNRDFGFVSQLTTANNRLSGSGSDVYRRNSMFGRATYNYDDKYEFTANIRRDGVSTAFGPNNKYGVFPSVSVGWKLINENFMKGAKIFSYLKLRATYGTLGNSDVESFLFVNSYTSGYPAVMGANGPILTSFNINTRMGNNDIRWEEVASANIGADMSFLKNALTVSIDLYSRQTKKMIYDVPIAGSAGQGDQLPLNIGQMSNKGIELLINYNGRINKDLSYSIGFNGAYNTNKLITLDPKAGGVFFDGDLNNFYGDAPVSKTEPGQPLGQFFGWISNGIYQTDADASKGPKVGAYTPRAGDLIYKDLTGDGQMDEDDRTYIGNPWPKLTYGINLSVQYKSFDLSMLLTGVMGVDIYNAQASYRHNFFGDYNTTSNIFNTSFFNGNGVTSVPRSYYPQGTPDVGGRDPNNNWSQVSSYHVQNGSFLKMRNIQLGYNFTNKLTKFAGISSARFFVMADNLFVITKYKGYDPEIAGGVRSRGIDNSDGRYPSTRLLALGFNVNF